MFNVGTYSQWIEKGWGEDKPTPVIYMYNTHSHTYSTLSKTEIITNQIKYERRINIMDYKSILEEQITKLQKVQERIIESPTGNELTIVSISCQIQQLVMTIKEL